MKESPLVRVVQRAREASASKNYVPKSLRKYFDCEKTKTGTRLKAKNNEFKT